MGLQAENCLVGSDESSNAVSKLSVHGIGKLIILNMSVASKLLRNSVLLIKESAELSGPHDSQ